MTKLYRSRTDRKITGLCGGLADMLGFDATLLRLIVAITAVFTSGIVIFIYVLAALVIPSEPWTDGGAYAGGQGAGAQGPNGVRWDQQYDSWKDYKRAEKHYRKAQKYGWGAGPSGFSQAGPSAGAAGEPTSELDDMMKDIEKKAMQKEIEELRAKVKRYEQELDQNNNNNKGAI
ncbi:PspC domain-containing protein [Paenibacillus sp. YYML68]|uniref:PspC domain-containing protein n=1 Tax=Paenibacillus sp. YYML68 TaxID=2909250 RepID=UPI002491522D|nr:PspC domain-containing protein [Paenibacillus sp. YYML68]